MSGRPIEIRLDIESSDAERGAERIADALDGVTDSADDLGRNGARSADNLADGLDSAGDSARDLGNDAERAMRDVEDAAADAGQQITRDLTQALDESAAASASAGDDIGRNMRDGADGASEGMEQMSGDAEANAREVAASFDGSAESLVDGFQGAAAEMFSGFGPAGAAAGLVVAAGVGVAMSKMEEAKEKAQETAEEIAGIADELIGLAGVNAGPDAVIDRLKEATTTVEDGKNELQEWKEMAEKAGVSFSDFALGMAGDADAAQRSTDELNTSIAEEKANLKTLSTELSAVGDARGTEGRAIVAQMDASRANITVYEDTRKELTDVHGLLDDGTALYEDYTGVISDSTYADQMHTEQLEAKAEAQQESIDVTRAAIDSELDYLDTMEASTAALTENASAGFDKHTAAGRENLRTIGEMADATLEYADATLASTGSQAEANKIIAAGRDQQVAMAKSLGMTAEEANAYADSLGLVPRSVTTDIKVSGVDAANTSLDGVTAARTVTVTPSVSTSVWDNFINGHLNKKTYTVPVTPSIVRNLN